jgi:two-component system nitrogen regulation sensor histidine kinase NtrY
VKTETLGVSRFGDLLNTVGRWLAGRVAAASLALLAGLAVAVTYAWFAGLTPAAFATQGWMTALLIADLMIAIALVAVLTVRLTQLWLDRRRGAAGSRLHMRLVLACSLFTIVPTLIVAVILSLLVVNLTDFVVRPSQKSFEAARAIGEPVRRAREEEINRDIGSVAAGLQALGADAIHDKNAVTPLLSQLIEGRPLIEAAVIDGDKGLIARAEAPGVTPIANPVPAAQFLWQAVNQAQPVQFDSPNGVYYVMQLFVGEPLFLVTGHIVDPRVTNYIGSMPRVLPNRLAA